MVSWRSIFVFLLLLLAFADPVRTHPSLDPVKFQSNPALSITDTGSWKAIRKGTEFRKVTLERVEPRHLIELKMARLDTRWVTPRIVSSQQYNLKGADVKTLAEKSGAIAIVNANYFDENGRPLGFLKVDSQEINPGVSKSSLFTGIFGIKNHRSFIIHRDQFSAREADEGLQAGPLLLLHGTALHVTRGAGRQSRRSLIGIDKKRRLIIAVAHSLLGGLSWVEVQEFFGSRQWQVETADLLNLDGGGSAQIYVKGLESEEHVSGNTDVPVALGFFSRGNSSQ